MEQGTPTAEQRAIEYSADYEYADRAQQLIERAWLAAYTAAKAEAQQELAGLRAEVEREKALVERALIAGQKGAMLVTTMIGKLHGAVLAEREACALECCDISFKVDEHFWLTASNHDVAAMVCRECVAAIRARSDGPPPKPVPPPIEKT